MPDDFAKEIAVEAAKEVAKEVYNDAGKPITAPTGELVGLIPRAIKAALAPVEKWVLQREYNVAETKKLLEEKLQNTPPELIESPEAHIAVPALQYISYCMDNNELRDMYANLLANSMNKVVKNGVHPSFVEVIKQLSPDEAKLLRYMRDETYVPTVSLRVDIKKGGRKDLVKEFSIAPFEANCENPYNCERYFDNLVRLGLVSRYNTALTDKDLYTPVKDHPYIAKVKKTLEKAIADREDFGGISFGEHHIEISEFGKSFALICLGPSEIRPLATVSITDLIRSAGDFDIMISDT